MDMKEREKKKDLVVNVDAKLIQLKVNLLTLFLLDRTHRMLLLVTIRCDSLVLNML